MNFNMLKKKKQTVHFWNWKHDVLSIWSEKELFKAFSIIWKNVKYTNKYDEKFKLIQSLRLAWLFHIIISLAAGCVLKSVKHKLLLENLKLVFLSTIVSEKSDILIF